MPSISFTIGETLAAKRRFPLFLVDDTDGSTPEDGEDAGQPQISINGGAFNSTFNLLVFISDGAYYVELTVLELNTLGIIRIRYKSANTREFQMPADVLPGGDSSIDELKSLMLRNLRKTNRIEQLLKERDEAILTDIDHEEFL